MSTEIRRVKHILFARHQQWQFSSRILIAVPPKIQPFAFPKTGTVGERSSVTCTTIAGDKPFKFVWLKDGLTLRQEGNVKIVSSSEFSVFNIEKLSLENAGNYTCVVSNAGGTVSYASTLEIKGN